MEIGRSGMVVCLGITGIAVVKAGAAPGLSDNWFFGIDTDGCQLLQRLLRRLLGRDVLSLRGHWRLLLRSRLLRLRNSRNLRDGLLQRIHGDG